MTGGIKTGKKQAPRTETIPLALSFRRTRAQALGEFIDLLLDNEGRHHLATSELSIDQLRLVYGPSCAAVVRRKAKYLQWLPDKKEQTVN